MKTVTHLSRTAARHLMSKSAFREMQTALRLVTKGPLIAPEPNRPSTPPFRFDHYEDDDADDGVEVVMKMLEPESNKPSSSSSACLQLGDALGNQGEVGRLIRDWESAEWGCKVRKGMGKRKLGKEGQRAACFEAESAVVEWDYREDCVVADVMTRVHPDEQKEAIKKRLPRRKWSEVAQRFRVLCEEVVGCEGNGKDGKADKDDAGRAADANMKPKCAIAKFKKWRSERKMATLANRRGR